MKGEKLIAPSFSVRTYVEHARDSTQGRCFRWGLTPRQLEVWRMIAESHTTKQIALKLDISVKTVESHRMGLMERLNIHDVAGLVRYAIKTGLININDEPGLDLPATGSNPSGCGLNVPLVGEIHLKMLIAEDSAALRERLAELFSAIEAIEVVGQARDVPEALAAIRALQPDVVILDIQMPGGSGIDVLRYLKQNYPSTITVMLTNHSYPQYERKCAELGADYFICKSTDAKVLIEIGEQLAGVN